MRKIKIRNGEARSNTGYRQVALTRTGQICPVLFAVRSGLKPGRCTTQLVAETDIVFRCDWDRQGEIWSATTPGGQNLFTDPEIWGLLPTELRDWLKPVGRGESLLPAGFGWDGEQTLADRQKRQRLENFFSGATGVERIINEAMRSPKDGLPMNWEQAADLPGQLDAPAEQWDGSCVDIRRSTVWVLWHLGGRVEVIRPEPTSGDWGSNYAHSDSGEFSAAPLAMPSSVLRACQISVGAYCSNHCTHGVSWRLYRRQQYYQQEKLVIG